MTLLTIALTLAAAANSCTFCYSVSKFEQDCQDRGGKVRTFADTQTCVMQSGHVAGNVIEEDAGP